MDLDIQGVPSAIFRRVLAGSTKSLLPNIIQDLLPNLPNLSGEIHQVSLDLSSEDGWPPLPPLRATPQWGRVDGERVLTSQWWFYAEEGFYIHVSPEGQGFNPV
jgi:hypothetical protein